MDRAPRVLAFRTLSVIQTCAMLLSATMVVHAFRSGVTAGATAVGLFCEPWFVVLALAGAVERMAGLASGVAFERDWVVQVKGGVELPGGCGPIGTQSRVVCTAGGPQPAHCSGQGQRHSAEGGSDV